MSYPTRETASDSENIARRARSGDLAGAMQEANDYLKSLAPAARRDAATQLAEELVQDGALPLLEFQFGDSFTQPGQTVRNDSQVTGATAEEFLANLQQFEANASDLNSADYDPMAAALAQLLLDNFAAVEAQAAASDVTLNQAVDQYVDSRSQVQTFGTSLVFLDDNTPANVSEVIYIDGTRCEVTRDSAGNILQILTNNSALRSLTNQTPDAGGSVVLLAADGWSIDTTGNVTFHSSDGSVSTFQTDGQLVTQVGLRDAFSIAASF